MSIVTFYSYKGGVGRSMALANVAMILSRRGKRVLVVDWDLEAPGLEEYFFGMHPTATEGRGLLHLLDEHEQNPDYCDYIWKLDPPGEGATIDLMPSGRDEPTYYPQRRCCTDRL